MVKKKNKRLKAIRRKSSSPILVGESIFSLLEAMGGSRERSNFAELWENWRDAAGEELAELAAPLGYDGHTLILCSEDGMAIQEARMRGEEFLECANTYLRTEYFEKLKIVLKGAPARRKGLQGKRARF